MSLPTPACLLAASRFMPSAPAVTIGQSWTWRPAGRGGCSWSGAAGEICGPSATSFSLLSLLYKPPEKWPKSGDSLGGSAPPDAGMDAGADHRADAGLQWHPISC